MIITITHIIIGLLATILVFQGATITIDNIHTQQNEEIAQLALKQVQQHDNITQHVMDTILLNTEVLNKINITTLETSNTIEEVNATVN